MKRAAEPDASRGDDEKRSRRTVAAQSTAATTADHVSELVLAFAAKNRRRRFFIPSKENSFGGISYEHVMVDSGCSSALFPFPQDVGTQLVQRFPPNAYRWSISQSHGTGASHCPVLKIQGRLRRKFKIILNGKNQPVSIRFMRFHLGSVSSAFARDNFDNCLPTEDVDTLRDFLQSHPADVPERRHVLLGQSYCDEMFSAQVGDIMIFMDDNTWEDHAASIPQFCIQCQASAGTMIDSYQEFHDLQDDDHDGDDQDEEDARLSWDSEEEDIDELIT